MNFTLTQSYLVEKKSMRSQPSSQQEGRIQKYLKQS